MHDGAIRSHVRMLMFAAVAVAGVLFAPSVHAGAGDNVTGWGWSASIGWISMNCTNDATCGTVDYGMTIMDTPGFGDRGDLQGWAWSETVGWICFGLTCSGTTPEGDPPFAQYRQSFNGKDDQFWGWAKVLSMGDDGWISLNCDKVNNAVIADECGASNYFTILNNLNGNFTLGGANDHWGWGASNIGAGVGWVDLSIVNTSWTLAKLGTIRRPEGVFEPQNMGLPGTHLFTFPITFENFSAAPNHLLECEISLPDASERVLNKVISASVRNGTETLQYTVQNADDIQPNALWYIDVCRIASTAGLTACATDADCAPAGICDENLAKCRGIIEQSDRRRPIFTHENVWTGLDALEDQYSAIKCHAGFPDNYFRNAAQCDFTGDASFALAMRRGFPIEGNCDDGIDNDGNGQADCNGAGMLPPDRYCTGIAYRCQTRPRTTCSWGASGDGIGDCSDAGYVMPTSAGQLCCSRQQFQAIPSQYHIVDGLECTHQDPNDGYFDCDCTGGAIGTYADCYAPGYQAGDLCCDANDDVVKP